LIKKKKPVVLPLFFRASVGHIFVKFLSVVTYWGGITLEGHYLWVLQSLNPFSSWDLLFLQDLT
jgi:hypothetical protein